MAIRYLDGRGFARGVAAGADWVRHTRRHLNRINVFPVPDGDTGTNMALSLAATAEAIRDSDDDDLHSVLDRVAEASVLGAKGNSGLIMAHWFLGLARGVDRKARVDCVEFARGLTSATESVYLAIEKPVEGTILTIMRAVSERAHEVAERSPDIATLLDELVGAAEVSLAKTPQMLEALREAQVVDAGAQGFVNFLDGVRGAILGRPSPMPEVDQEEDFAHAAPGHDSVPTFRFCTELIVRGKAFDDRALRARFGGFGDSMLVASTGRRFKLHIHTDRPEELIKDAAHLGEIEERKVDDMLRQSRERDEGPRPPLVPLAEQPTTPAIVCDSCCDIPEAMARELGIEQVPLQLLLEDRVILDRFDLPTAELYEKIFRHKLSAGTSQPPPGQFVEAFRRIRPDRDIIVCSLSAALSGTYKSAQSGARLADQARVEVFDTGTGSLGQGMMAIGAARMAARGATTDEILAQLARWKPRSSLVFTVATLEYLQRSGRISRARGMLGNLMGVRPIFGIGDGYFEVLDKRRGTEKIGHRVMELVCASLPAGSSIRVGLVESTESGALDQAEQILRERYDVREVIRTPITAIIGAHMGPGAWGVFTQQIDPEES